MSRPGRRLAQLQIWQYVPAMFALNMILGVLIAYVSAWATGGVTGGDLFFTRTGHISVAYLAVFAGILTVGMAIRRAWAQRRRPRHHPPR